MKTILTAAALALSPLPALSQPTQADVDLVCGAAESLAGNIMDARQSGASMSALLQAVTIDGNAPEANSLARALVTDAYSRPAFRSAEYQERATRDFANAAAVTCHQAMSGAGE